MRDANDILRDSGDGALYDELKAAETAAKIQAVVDKHSAVGALRGESNFFSNDFEANVQRRRQFLNRKTGFANLDAADVQTFTPGLYILGGLPAVGKTSFAWQLGDSLAAAGEPVFYVSFEMSPQQLRAKTIARMLHQSESPESGYVARFSAADIANGKTDDHTARLLVGMKKSARNFYVLEANNKAGAKPLIDLFNDFRAILDRPPVVVIDYLQRMPRPEKFDIREGVGFNAYEFKNWQLKTDATVIALSSFNRDSYYQPASFISFKESGEVEFSADVLWALQFYCVRNFGSDNPTNLQMLAEAKKRQPREMELACLKNREGSTYEVHFNYFSKFDNFIPADLTTFDSYGGENGTSQNGKTPQKKHK